MPIWSEIALEIQSAKDPRAFDNVRRKYLVKLAQYTGRNTILYSSRFTQPVRPDVQPDELSINDGDLQGLMETLYGLKGDGLDLILHSPGGGLDAAEALVTYLHTKVHDLRVIVPHLAMSAATLVACSARKVVLGKHSFLGPIDPQFVLYTPLGTRMVPAQAVLEQFELAARECQDQTRLAAWLPMLSLYGPDLLVQCRNAVRKSQELARQWLRKYMFDGAPAAGRKAATLTRWLSDHSGFGSHSRHIARGELEEKGLVVERLEDDQEFQDLVLSVYHATTCTFTGTPAVKIIENHLGRAFIVSVGQPAQVPPQSSTPPSP